MCVVVPRHPGKGDPLRVSRCIPPGLWRFFGIEPHHRQRNVRRFDPRSEGVFLPLADTIPDHACSPPGPATTVVAGGAQSGARAAPEARARLVAPGDDRGDFGSPMAPIEQEREFALLLHHHRPTVAPIGFRPWFHARSLPIARAATVIHIVLFSAPIGMDECVSTGYTVSHERFGAPYSHRARPARKIPRRLPRAGSASRAGLARVHAHVCC